MINLDILSDIVSNFIEENGVYVDIYINEKVVLNAGEVKKQKTTKQENVKVFFIEKNFDKNSLEFELIQKKTKSSIGQGRQMNTGDFYFPKDIVIEKNDSILYNNSYYDIITIERPSIKNVYTKITVIEE